MLLACIASNTFGFNMAYVEVNSNSLKNTACYIRSDTKTPYLNMVSIFAANINGDSPNSPYVYFNDQVTKVLKSDQIAHLHKKGMKVLITLLGNHQKAGWNCMTDEGAAQQFANSIVDMVNQYDLDGVDIDDEYSYCVSNHYSITMIAQYIKSNPAFAGKILTKALFGDHQDFTTSYNHHFLNEYLDYGWEMRYQDGDFDSRNSFYASNGMTAKQLMIGGWTEINDPSPFEIASYNISNNLAGNMIYDVTNKSQTYLDGMIKAENSELNVLVQPNCLE